jgi:hypothetical protein
LELRLALPFGGAPDEALGPYETLNVINARNDFLHGKVDPKQLAFDTVFFDDYRVEGACPRPLMITFDNKRSHLE